MVPKGSPVFFLEASTGLSVGPIVGAVLAVLDALDLVNCALCNKGLESHGCDFLHSQDVFHDTLH